MKYSKIILPALAWLLAFAVEAKTPGMAAYREQNYGAAARLLSQELSLMPEGSDEFFNHEMLCIESMLLCGRTNDAVKKITALRTEIPEKFKSRFAILNAQSAYIQQNFKLCQKLLDELEAEKNLPVSIRYNVVLLRSEILLRSNRAADAVKILQQALADTAVAKEGELTLTMTLMRALAADNKLNEIPRIFNELKKKYPAQQGKLQHFELLIHAINQDLKKYNELFKKIFPSERPLYTFIGDVVLYQGSLLAEQQAQNEKNKNEIAFHLKNQTIFAPDDELRAASWQNLIQLHIDNDQLPKALYEVRSMLKKIPGIKDKVKWEFLCADLQTALKEGDSGLKIYLAIKNNHNADISLRAKAAEKAAEIYKSQGKKTEVLKLYAFISDIPGQSALNDRGILLNGKFYFENRQYRMSQSLLSRINLSSESYPEALFYLIQCKISNGEHESASGDIKNLAAMKYEKKYSHLPEFSLAANYFQAVLLEATDKDEEAAILYEKTARTVTSGAASTPMLINSWLKAAELQFKRKSFSNAGLLFLSFAEHYPTNNAAPAALYKSVYSYFLAGRYDEMKYSIEKLCKNHSDHKLTISALFHEMDHLRQNNRLQEALKVLDNIEKINRKNNNSETEAQIIYDRALTFYHLQRDSEALQLLGQLQKYQNQTLKSEGLFLAGTIFQEQGDNLKAAEYFRNASKNRSDLLFVQICLGRCADNLFLAGTKNKNENLLKQASEIYASQVKNSALDKTFRLQSLYKWGRTSENLNDPQAALDAYTEALYLIDPDRESVKGNIIPVWINKSAVNAINIHLHQGGSNALNEALFIIRRLKKLNTMSAEELENLEYNVRNRYINND